jgi:hypothetical protein
MPFLPSCILRRKQMGPKPRSAILSSRAIPATFLSWHFLIARHAVPHFGSCR